MAIFQEILMILFVNIFVLWIFSLLRLPEILGLIFTGFLLGPYGFKFIQNSEDIEIISEIGLILLLFTIGLEFSFKELQKNKRDVVVIGFLQVSLTFLISLLVLQFLPLITSIVLGMVISLSSTAIVLKIFQDQNEIHTPYGKVSISILIFQDLIAIIYLLFLPFLKEISQLDYSNIGIFHTGFLLFVLKMILFLLIFFLLYKYIIPFVLVKIVQLRNRDIFVLSIITLCFLIAFLTYKVGLSLAFGAFLAGLLISETPFSFESMSNVIPFKIIFTSIFFTSIGMLIDIYFLFSLKNLLFVLFLLVFIFLIKSVVIFFIILFFYRNLRIAFISSLSLFQVGEFSFIVLKNALNLEIIDHYTYQAFLVSSIFTMLLTPFLILKSQNLSDKFVNFINKLNTEKNRNFLSKFFKTSSTEAKEHSSHLDIKDHIIIVGFGINGRNVAKAAQIMDIPYVILEMNIKTVQNEKKSGEPIFYGDATNEALLKHVQIEKAKLLVIVINDFQSTKRIISIAKKLNPNIYIIARTRYVLEVPKLFEIGADEVIPEEFETSIQIFRKILEHYNYSFGEIQFFTEELRISGYDILRREQIKS
ncbi:MAG: cation:proton antiporter [Leptospiraceae bacterium]|nr:cation:proton antiporter [Leptospiraceae bacterium]MDW7976789.1 cation:proton antiporter [Leptospiraceae bacterium]